MERLSPHLQEVQKINHAILKTRNDYVANYRRGFTGSKALTYEPGIDRSVYATLKQFETTQDNQPQYNAYLHARNELNAQTTYGVETFIGERLNAGLSTYIYDVKNGQLYGQRMDEPLLDMIQRGRDCRDYVVRDIDKPRQDAEIIQFQKIQQIFGDPITPLGTAIVSMSPTGGPGSAYGKNFDDIFELRVDESTNERYIQARRFASGLSLEERKLHAKALNPDYFVDYKGEPLDSYFLSHPLVIPHESALSGDPEAIHKYLHKGHDFLSTEDFVEVKRQIAGLIVSYVTTLCDTPDDKEFLEKTLNVVMRQADIAAEGLRRPHTRMQAFNKQPLIVPATRDAMIEEGKKQVRSVATGCGDSSGFGQDREASNMVTTFSMRDFGTDKLGNRVFDCPECGQMNVRPVNELVKNCQNCGSDKVGC